MTGHITIVRNKQVVNDTTFGKMFFTNERGETVEVGHTIELPWRNNARRISCIPCGEYELVEHNSAKFGSVVAFVNPALKVWHMPTDIPREFSETGRSACLIHAANWGKELLGCVAVGKEVVDFGAPNGLGVSSSRPTLNELRAMWGMRRGLTAKIKWAS